MSLSYEVSGTVLLFHPTQTFASGFKKREFVVKSDEEKYPQEIKLETVKDACDKLDAFQEGDEIKVWFNLRGNEYNGKHYVNLQAWKFEGEGSPAPRKSSPPARERQQLPPPPAADDFDEDDDIPF